MSRPHLRARSTFASAALILAASLAIPAFGQQTPAPEAKPAAEAPATETNAASGFQLDKTRVLLQTSLYGRHWHPQPDHNNNFRLINIEAQRPDNWLYGFAYFHNSFDQASQYLYFGKQWRQFTSYPLVHLKLTGGLLHGYRGEYRDKIRFNGSGVAPALLPSIGLSGKRFESEVILFGTAGFMWTVGVYLN